MDISIVTLTPELAGLLERVEAGEEIVLTRDGRPTARLSAIEPPVDLEARRRKLLDLSATMALEKLPGADAVHSADWMYDEFGLPG